MLFPLLLFTLYLSICFFIPSDYDTLKITTIFLVKNSFLSFFVYYFNINMNIHQYQQSTSLFPLFSHHHCCIHPTLPFLPSHISSPATTPSPTSSSSSECASSLSPRKLQLYPSCRQPLLVSR